MTPTLPHNPEAESEATAIKALSKPDPLLEELQVVRLEGRYFCFDRHEAKNRQGVLQYRDGNRGLVIEVSPRYGHPSVLAYKVLQAVFRKVTLEGKPYPDTVSFSYRELGRMIGRDVFGGRDSQQLYDAIRQLEDTKIELYLYDKDGKEFRSFRFNLIISSGFIGSGEVTGPTRIKAAALTLHPVIMDSMRRGHFAIFNWARLEEMEPLSAALYKRLYLHFSNLYEEQYDRRSLKFEKDYEALCQEWLGGLKPERYKSRIMHQLGHHLALLRETGLVRFATIEDKSGSKGFKLVFRPGNSFFEDYAAFYQGNKARVLQFQHAADQADIKGPIDSVANFYKKLHKVDTLDGKIFAEKDIEFAKRLIDAIGTEGFTDLVEFALEEAPKTNFQMKNIRAIETYLPAWQAGKEKRKQEQATRKAEDDKRRQERLQSEYESFCQAEHFNYMETASETERAEIKRLAEEHAASKNHEPGHPMYRITVRLAEKAILAKRCALPPFEQWLTTRH